MGTVGREAVRAASRASKAEALFERLARRHYAGVYSYLCWLAKDEALAADLTQETFVQVWRYPPEARGERPLRAWLYRIARNEYLQHRRRAGLGPLPFDDAREQETASGEPEPELRLEREELRQSVRTAVESLPELYREVIVLYNLEELSLPQVAEVLRIPIGTVKSRRAKAFQLLRQLLRDQEVS